MIPVEHDVLGEDLLLVLQVRPGAPAGDAELGPQQIADLEAQLRATLPKSKRPRQVVEGRLSRNALGKIDRKALRALVESHRGQWLPILRGES